MKRKSGELRPILKRTLPEIFEELKKIKSLELRESFKKDIAQSDLYQSLPEKEQMDLMKKSGQLASSVVGSINCTFRNNKSKGRELTYLETIQKSDGTLDTSFYWRMVDLGKISDDQLSIKIIRILSNNPQVQKQGLLRLSALPENLDDKPYAADYLEFCAKATREIMGVAIEIGRKKLEEESKGRVKKKRNVSWVERTSSNQANSNKSSSPALPPS